MAGHGVDDDPSLKGISRYFNSQTNRGRANTAKVTVAFCAMYYVYHKLFKSGKKPAPKK
ncbi:hypothetical protein ABMA28_012243 [Loxostege sticticalis]|uniref:Uncharacterized protein n=1 Tax=Loxostege sticticalis TaxID=481309 RepID=A0ABD0TM61_LOXSC